MEANVYRIRFDDYTDLVICAQSIEQAVDAWRDCLSLEPEIEPSRVERVFEGVEVVQ